MSNLLSTISHPSQVRKLSLDELEQLANQCRERIIDVTSKVGGHLASSLGTVELTIALLHFLNLKKDRIIWDVGHQAYTYKILTGRNEKLPLLGKRNGIAKFLRREESEFDHFGAGHASTSISAAVGMATADHLHNKNNKTIAIIGDGGLTGGLAFEAINHAGHLDLDNLIVILNDNEMSIDPNVGALSKTVINFQASRIVNKLRTKISSLDAEEKIPHTVYKGLKRFNDSFMAFFTPGEFFEQLQFRYFGPIDGHSIQDLTSILEQLKNVKGPILLHTITKKGKGYSPAEGNSFAYHGVTPFEPANGKFHKKAVIGKSYTNIWSNAFSDVIKNDDSVVAISAAMIGNTGLKPIQEAFPERVFDVGIAEGHAVTFSAGMATQGLKPFVVIYSTFLQRAFDHIIHDVALQNLPVRFILDRAGFVGADGATHHGVFDLSYLRMIPNFVVMVPKNGTELTQMVKTAYEYDKGPIALRFPRGNTTDYTESSLSEVKAIPIGEGELIQRGKDLLLIAVGTQVDAAVQIASRLKEKGIDCGILNARFVKPLDKNLIIQEVSKVRAVITLEENAIMGGFGSAVSELLHEENVFLPVKQFGIPDQFIEFSTPEEQKEEAKLDEESVFQSLVSFWSKLNSN
ncbi:MAG: 1-deoxy-D-xylulose-5-phosphate synthase [bacterium]|jgi:1-deoxy-D-xylulose-5-phosphate synthase